MCVIDTIEVVVDYCSSSQAFTTMEQLQMGNGLALLSPFSLLPERRKTPTSLGQQTLESSSSSPDC